MHSLKVSRRIQFSNGQPLLWKCLFMAESIMDNLNIVIILDYNENGCIEKFYCSICNYIRWFSSAYKCYCGKKRVNLNVKNKVLWNLFLRKFLNRFNNFLFSIYSFPKNLWCLRNCQFSFRWLLNIEFRDTHKHLIQETRPFHISLLLNHRFFATIFQRLLQIFCFNGKALS